MRRPLALALSSLSLAVGCGQEEAVVDYVVTDANPAVPMRALQYFELPADRIAITSSDFVWADRLEMPNVGSLSFFDDTPEPFRLCVVGLALEDDLPLHAVSEPIQPVLGETIEIELALTRVEPGGEVPEPCGPEVDPWPDGV